MPYFTTLSSYFWYEWILNKHLLHTTWGINEMKPYQAFDFEAICWAKYLIGVSNFCGVSEIKIRAKIDIAMSVVDLSDQVM